MADLADILIGLHEELWKKILVTQPQTRGGGELSFRYVDPQRSVIEEQAGAIRVFDVRLAELTPKWLGCPSTRHDVKFEARVGYPKRGWEIVAASDFGVLRGAINATGGMSTVTGVGYRVVTQVSPVFAYVDDWMWMTFEIAAVVETA